MRAQRFETYGMTCPACPGLLEHALERIPGVISAEADLTRGTTSVVYDGALTDEASIAQAIQRLGFDASAEMRRAG